MGTDDGQDEKSYQFNEPIRWTKVSLRGQNGKKDAQARKIIKIGLTARNKMAEILGSSHGLSLPLHIPKSQSSHASLKEGSVSGRSELPPPSHSEQDFTTERRDSKLECPFVVNNDPKLRHHSSFSRPKLSNHSKSLDGKGHPRKPPLDPIEVDAKSRRQSLSPPPSVANSAGKCPIRFLDQHSPEEVAEYFENHKHEIPRSHAVCVKRYQSNSESIRQLDAKYGNLVNMIQGLGVKHKSLLPTKDEMDSAPAPQRNPNDRVEKWAKAVSASMDGQEEPAEEHNEQREGHFDRPMKEVRVGESPSRPWGISVPVQATPLKMSGAPNLETPRAKAFAPSGGTSNAHEKLDHNVFDDTPAQQAPHATPQQGVSNRLRDGVRVEDNVAFVQAPAQRTTPGQHEQSPRQPQMVFTGPVFIGYPVEQAVSFMQQAGLGSSPQR